MMASWQETRPLCLYTKLLNAKKALNKDNPDQAIKQLEQFIQHVVILVNQGYLTAENGDALIQEAELIIAMLE